MVNHDGSYTWTFYTDIHPLQVSVGSDNITTSTLTNRRMLLTFTPTYRRVTDEAAAIMRKIFDKAQLQDVTMPDVEYSGRYGEWTCYLAEGDERQQLLEALVLKVQSDPTLRDELEIRDLEVEYI
jgi:hypothetical protein